MPTHLCITIRFLQPTYHGRGDRNEPEWPPSPLRLFQSLIAAAAARWNERTRLESAAQALRWLEQQPPPSIVAAIGDRSSTKYRLYVPDNVGDRVAGSWSRGGAASLADYRTEKDVCPTHIRGADEAVHYLWQVSGPDFAEHKDILLTAAQSITHLGWGVDMVVANASVISDADSDALVGERWQPADERAATSLRVPVEGTLSALIAKHSAFLNRLGPEGFTPVPPLTAFRVLGYRRATDPPRRPFAAFSLLKLDASGFRSFDTARRGIAVSGMMRHAASSANVAAALGWSSEKVAGFVLGHGEPSGQPHVPAPGPRLAFIPLPSIEPRGNGRAEVVTSIRRVMITIFNGQDQEAVQQLGRVLSGSELIAEETREEVALLARLPDSDTTVRRYTRSAATWATVTPVILPGYDDPRKVRKRLLPNPNNDGSSVGAQEQKDWLAKLDKRIDHLLRKAIRQAGFSEDLARFADVDWSTVGFWPGTEPSTRYVFPTKLRRYRRLHVRISWRDSSGNPIELPGPICLGGGRFSGLGLFAPVN